MQTRCKTFRPERAGDLPAGAAGAAGTSSFAALRSAATGASQSFCAVMQPFSSPAFWPFRFR